MPLGSHSGGGRHPEIYNEAVLERLRTVEFSGRDAVVGQIQQIRAEMLVIDAFSPVDTISVWTAFNYAGR